MSEMQDILAERGKRYGEFAGHAEISQRLKSTVEMFASRRLTNLQPDQNEALDMICHKIARILNGDPNYVDSWLDIAGYATLVVERLQEPSDRV